MDLRQERTFGPELPREQEIHGKLRTLGTRGRAHEGENNKACDIISQVNPAGAYKVVGDINGAPTSLLVDTGAAVTISDDIWERVNATKAKLEPWTGQCLVGVGGLPLHVRGHTRVDLNLTGEHFDVEVVVVSPLSTKALLGLDFLLQNEATNDLSKGGFVLP